MATRTTKTETEETVKEAVEKVKIMLPAPRDDSEEEFELVGLNGVMYQIQKGVEVEVPVGVKEILDNREKLRASNRKTSEKGRI